jgi:hypothetical protein
LVNRNTRFWIIGVESIGKWTRAQVIIGVISVVVTLILGISTISHNFPTIANTKEVYTTIDGVNSKVIQNSTITINNNNPASAPTPVQDNPLLKAANITNTQAEGICYYDWEEVNRSTDSSGYNYITIKLYIKNDANVAINTEPLWWKLSADGQLYEAGRAWSNVSWDESHLHGNLWVKLVKGGVAESRVQYRVNGSPSINNVVYTMYNAPKMERTKYY